MNESRVIRYARFKTRRNKAPGGSRLFLDLKVPYSQMHKMDYVDGMTGFGPVTKFRPKDQQSMISWSRCQRWMNFNDSFLRLHDNTIICFHHKKLRKGCNPPNRARR